MADLRREGKNNTAVAAYLGVSVSTLYGWKAGAQPPYDDGARLLEYWVEITGQPRSAIPEIDEFDWRA